MAIFHFKPPRAHLGSHLFEDIAGAIHWNYDRAELVADGVVHVLGLCFGLIASIALIVLSGKFSPPSDMFAVSIYALGLLTMLALSAAYNMWPVSPRKWLLRRFDHSAIYVLIAGTYTPFVMQIKDSTTAMLLLGGIWMVAIIGVLLKLFMPGRFDRVSIGLYLAMGWSGVAAYDAVVSSLPVNTLVLLAIGGLLYTFGVIFHAWQRLRFQNAIWHGFVLSAAACHYVAVLDLVLA